MGNSGNGPFVQCQDHQSIYKWHRRYEQLLALCQKRFVTCTVKGNSICPPLMELFFAADKRIWASSSHEVRWCEAPFAYSPGPAALQGLRPLPLAMLRRLLVVGLPVEEAVACGFMTLTDGASIPVPSRAWVSNCECAILA